MKEIHYDFGMSWLLMENDLNIFNNQSVVVDPFSFVPLFGFDDVDVNSTLFQMANEQCEGEFSCIYDVIVTEVIEIANVTLEFVEFVKETEITNS